MYYVYILYSPSRDQYYSGHSRYHEKRRRQHRKGKTKSIRMASDWEEVFVITLDTRDDARALEKKIKARGAKRFLEDKGL